MKTEDIPITRACLNAISYFSSVAGPYYNHSTIEMDDGEPPCGKWTWWADKNCLGDSKRPGDWLQLMLEDAGSLRVTIYQRYAPESLFYQIVGCTKHPGHKLELD